MLRLLPTSATSRISTAIDHAIEPRLTPPSIGPPAHYIDFVADVGATVAVARDLWARFNGEEGLGGGGDVGRGI